MSTPIEPDAGQNPVEEIVEDVLDDDARESKRGRYGWLSLVVAGLFGLFYAYDLWEAIGNVFLVNIFYTQLELTVPWAILIANLVVPPAVFVLAFALGRRHHVGGRALLFLAGLAIVAVLTLDLQSLV